MTSEDLDSLKSDPAILGIYGQYTRLKSIGNGKYQGLCPFPGHSEKTGSFTVFPDMRFQCFGCGKSGNIFQMIQEVDGVGFKEAVDKVKSVTGGKSEWAKTREKVESTFKPVAEPKTYKTVSLEQWKKMEDALEGSEAAKNWLLKERGITYETAKNLRLGFAQNIGNLAGDQGADIANKGWVAFPCIEGDKVVSIKYRSLVRKKPGGFARQSGMATAMFNTEAVSPFDPVYLVEGEFDSCVLSQLGLASVSVPSAGVKLTPQQKDLLMQAPVVFLAGDNDGGVGNAYMEKLWRELGTQAYLLKWPDGCKDANEALLKNCGGDQEKLRVLVNDLSRKAKSQPMPSVYSLQEAMVNGEDGQLSERSDRLRFPWPSVDNMLIVLPGHVFGVGATNTGMGKTLWTTQFSLFNARKYGRTVLNFQAEMDPSEIGDLVASQMLRVDRNFLTKEDRVKAANMLSDEGVQYYIGRDPNLTELKEVLDLLESAIRRLSPHIVILDHFHHFSAGADNEVQAQAQAMTRIKAMADKYKVIFVNVGQPRKATSQNKGKKIHVADFKGSGAWGDASNGVIIIHRELNKSDDLSTSKGPYEDKTLVQVLKGRSLGKGASACYLTCFGEFGSFEQIDTMHEDGGPDNGQEVGF